MDVQNILGFPPALNSTVTNPQAQIHHILSGSFRSLSLFLLAFSPSTGSLSHLQTIPAFGPHQYLATDQFRDRVYATTWAEPPSLSSWHVHRSDHDPWRVSLINTVPITATSSYITVPPPYTHVYSVGGPTGESHVIDPETGGFGERKQELLFVPENELATADKTRVALRYGSHGVEFTPSGRFAFVPVLGTNSIEMYAHDSSKGVLHHLASVGSPRGKEAQDGPRHVKIHPNGRILYCVTEHSNYVDAYRILPMTLEYVGSRSLIPKAYRDFSSTSKSKGHFRGDTLMLSPSTPLKPNPEVLITTTRGSTVDLRGWISIIPLDAEGNFDKAPSRSLEAEGTVVKDDAEWFQTPTSGGKANAIDVLAKTPRGQDGNQDGLWILLTDDDEATASSGIGAIRVLEWNGWGEGGIRIVAEWPPNRGSSYEEGDRSNSIQGASHAIWLN